MIFPTLKYHDPHAAMSFLAKAFGFVEDELAESDGMVMHARMRHGASMIMMSGIGAGDPVFDITPVCVYVVVDDIDAHYERAVAAGATILKEPTDQSYGSRDYAVRDPEGNVWAFGTYSPVPTSAPE